MLAAVPQDTDLRTGKDGITVTWPDGTSRFYHYVWLRNCCYCDVCGNSYEGAFTVRPHDIPLDIRPGDVRHSGNDIEITWSHDGHESRYDLNWLLENAYDDVDRNRRQHRPILWNGDISNHVPTVEYDAVRTDENQDLTFLRHLRDYGFVVVHGGPTDENSGVTMAGLIGDIVESTYGKLFDLNPASNQVTFGNTLNFVAPHTDEAYVPVPPGINILHCLRPADTGGESVLVDGFNLAHQLRLSSPEHFETLSTIPQSYHRVVPDLGIYHRIRGTVIKLDEDGNIAGFRFHPRTAAPLDVAGDDVPRVHAANAALSRLMMAQDNQACFRLQAGEAVFFDNHRVMHARKAFNDPNRHMQISAVPRERFHTRLRMAAHKLGYSEEALQYLAGGTVG